MKNYLSELGEDKIIEIVGKNASVSTNDDCAIIDLDNKHFLLASIDASYEFQDFPHFATFYEKAWQIVVCSLSDIAAMGGEPIGLLDCLELSANMTSDDLKQISLGINHAAREFGAKVLGGDINSSNRLGITVTVIGRVKKDEVLRRSGGKVNNKVGLIGHIGDYNAAYFAFKNAIKLSSSDKSYLLNAMLKLRPQIDIGRAIAKIKKVTSCIDLNDGLERGLKELARAGKLKIDIDEDSLPVSEVGLRVAKKLNMKPSNIALNFSGDLNLLITYEERDFDKIDEVVRKFKERLYTIGRVVSMGNLVTMNGFEMKSSGFKHFKTGDLFDPSTWPKFQR